jgi:SpoIID/LytB domain protein
MSQLGANEMAKQGSSCDEILSHYFPACKLCDAL